MSCRRNENFPVASLLLPGSVRPQVRALYDFARGADDMADNPDVDAPTRKHRLQALDHVLAGDSGVSVPGWMQPYADMCQSGVCDPQDGRDLLHAFMRDQEITRCASWEQMVGYCQYSAVPVGRSFLALCHETQADPEALAALCTCLQLINHLQDIQGDYRQLGRVYLPADWLEAADVQDSELGESSSSDGLRAVIDRVLHAMKPLMETACQLPATIRSRRLQLELRWVLGVVRALHVRLGACDPLAQRVTLPRYRFYTCWMHI